MLERHVLPIVFALLFWWISTGIIIFLDGLPRKTFKYSFAGMTALLGVSLWGLFTTRDDTTIWGAYLAFSWATLAWGWQEMSFYLGFVTGPRRVPCPDGCGGFGHFIHAIQTSLWHELAVIATAVVVVALTIGGANIVGLWTFMILWWMHQSAKLNVFFGVRNLNEEFLPEQLQFLAKFLTKKPMNVFFPFSVTLSTIITVLLLAAAFRPGISDFEAISYTFLGFLMVLAILEHWLLVLPLPTTIWNWSLKSRKVSRPVDIEVIAGFLGAGKTTYLRRLLATADPEDRTVVLVNDFGSVGVDGSLLAGRGADVVELPNGCVCCSLRSDLATQLRQVVVKFAPKRVLIEPSGVAEVAALLRAITQPALADVVKTVKVCTVVDSGRFLEDYARLPHFFEAQANVAPLAILNKVDRATPAELKTITDTLRAINPKASVVHATFGVVDEDARPLAIDVEAFTATDEAHDPAPPSFESWTTSLPGRYDEGALRDLLGAAAGGAFGDLARIKGIVRVRDGWVSFDLAGGQPSIRAFAPGPDEEPRIVAIGWSIHVEAIAAAVAGCRAASDEPAFVPAPA